MIKSFGVFSLVLAIFFLPGPFFLVHASPASGPKRIEVTAKRFSFDPGTITLQRGEPVILVLKSVDVPHGLRFRELNVEVKSPKGGSGEVQFTPDKDGDFVGHCSVFCGNGHGSMTLTLHVIG
jgi:cytochrome c oxidase subunit 2